MDHRAHPADPPVALEGHLDRVLHLAGVVGRHQVLPAALQPADRAAEPQGRERDQDVLGVELATDAEAPAHVDLGEA